MADIDIDVFETREGSGTFGPKLAKLAKTRDISTAVVPLKVGDIRIISTHMELVLLERKSTDADLFTSLSSGRLVDQCRRLAEEADIPILLIDGPIYISHGFVRGTRYRTRLRYSSLLNQLLTVQIELGVSVVQIQSKAYAPRWVLDCYRYFQKERHTSIIESRFKPFSTSIKGLTPKEEKLRILMAIPDVGREIADRLLDRYGSVWAVADAPIPSLRTVPGVGVDTAAKISKALN